MRISRAGLLLFVSLCVLACVTAILLLRSRSDGPISDDARTNSPLTVKEAQPKEPVEESPPAGSRPVPALRSRDAKTVSNEELLPMLCDPSYTPTTRNDAANRLLNNGDPLLAGKLISMLRNKSEDLTWRNYCIQFLRGCYEQQATPSSTSSEAPSNAAARRSPAEISAALFEACDYPEPELSSCAIWSLAQLASPKPWANAMPGAAKPNASLLPADADARIKEHALKALRDQKAHLLVRIGGAQSCARMGLTEAAPDLRQIAGDTKADLSIRTVAVAGLGQLKDESARELLTQLANDPSPRLKQAAQMALKALGCGGQSVKGESK